MNRTLHPPAIALEREVLRFFHAAALAPSHASSTSDPASDTLAHLRRVISERLPHRPTRAQLLRRRSARTQLLRLLYERALEHTRAELDEEHRRFVLERGHSGTKAASKEHVESLRRSLFFLCPACLSPIRLSNLCSALMLPALARSSNATLPAAAPVLSQLQISASRISSTTLTKFYSLTMARISTNVARAEYHLAHDFTACLPTHAGEGQPELRRVEEEKQQHAARSAEAASIGEEDQHRLNIDRHRDEEEQQQLEAGEARNAGEDDADKSGDTSERAAMLEEEGDEVEQGGAKEEHMETGDEQADAVEREAVEEAETEAEQMEQKRKRANTQQEAPVQTRSKRRRSE